MPVFPGSLVVHAADNFVSVSLNESFDKKLSGGISNLNTYLTSNKNRAIVLDMLYDWDAAKKSEFDRALVIPSGANVTLNMHGYAFNRNNAASDDYSSDGEVIRVEIGASLTINGSSNDDEKEREHKSVPVYTGYSEGIKANGRTDIKGGTIMGGVSSYTAGGIYVKDRCTVVLNDVTIAGCCSRDTWRSFNGYGGGIWLCEDDCRLTLNNSRITGCMSDDVGGGIYLGGEGVYVNGSGTAKISENQSGEAGGVYLQDQKESMSGLTISGNKSVNGAGIYMEGGVGTVLNSAQVLTDLVIKDNAASGRGGGIYIKKEMVTISSCEITGNKASTSGSGVYVYDDVNEGFNVKGATIIKDNPVESGKSNLYIADDKPINSRVMFDLTKGADVHMSYYGIGTTTAVMVTEDNPKKSPNCIQYLHADNERYHFAFNSNSRKI